MKKKVLIVTGILMLACSLCGCTTTKDAQTNAEENVEVAAEGNVAESEMVPTEPEITAIQVNDPRINPAESTEAESTAEETESVEEVEEEVLSETFTAKAPIKMVEATDETIAALNEEDLSTWRSSLSHATVTFPSTKEIAEDRVAEILSTDEYTAYLTENNDIWAQEDDSWTITKENFSYHHDWFQNITWQGQDDIHYFVVESADFDLGHALEIDDDRIMYDEKTDTVYLHLVYGYNYAEYVSFANAPMAQTLVEQTVSNRVLLTLDFDNQEELPVAEIVLVKPSELPAATE